MAFIVYFIVQLKLQSTCFKCAYGESKFTYTVPPSWFRKGGEGVKGPESSILEARGMDSKIFNLQLQNFYLLERHKYNIQVM